MSLKEFFNQIDDQVSTVLHSDFEIEITDTKFVPNFEDSNITFENLTENRKKCKRLESCVLFVDIRNSVKLSAAKRPKTLSKVYSSFVRSMIACGEYFNGYVRDIIGDRVMVVFDQENCFKNAVDTAILMNSVGKHILNKRITSTHFKCGIGIDYGQMLITKAGSIRQGAEKEFSRSLVWLGKPANIASRLTDLAFKTESYTLPGVRQGNHYRYIDEWVWLDRTYGQFIDDLEPTYRGNFLKHKDADFTSFYKTTLGPYSKSYNPILMTKAVYTGLKKHHPHEEALKNGWWSKNEVYIEEYSGDVFGGDVFFKAVKE